MKRRKAWSGIAIILTVIWGVSFFLNRDKTDPAERWLMRQNEENSDNRIIHDRNLEIEILSCTIVEEDDQSALEAYPVENFHQMEYPSSNDTYRFFDYEKMNAESEALKDVFEYPEKYTQEERDRIRKENIDIVEKYTYQRHPKTRFAFLECKITSSVAGKQAIAPFVYRRLQYGKKIDYDTSNTLVYFDKAMFRDWDVRSYFNWYVFTPGEPLECTLGFALREDFYLGNDAAYYLGGYPRDPDFEKLPDPKYDSNAVRIDEEFGKK